jgi:hypothetical protein
MPKPDIKPEKITSPIQLMAAWFVMLILLSGVLLTAATQIDKPDWAAGYLVISTTLLILGVIVCVILMLTKFRPNLQEGKEYAEWLKDQNRYSPGVIVEKEESVSHKTLQNILNRIKSVETDSQEGGVAKRIEDSALCDVSISPLQGARKVLKAMTDLGFKTSIDKSSMDDGRDFRAFEDHEAIWLGVNIPATTALTIIKKAVNVWPHLKYIHLSSDCDGPPEYVHWQIYLGGANSAAVDRYHLKPWTIEEINELEEKDIADFHKDIRSKYP